MRVLLVTPYSPFRDHDHAASDTLVPLVASLSKTHEVHVFTPDIVSGSELRRGKEIVHEVWAGSRADLGKVRAALGVRPYWAREVWTRRMTEEACVVAARIRADVVHCEYLQVGDVARRVSQPSVITLHDVTRDVMARALSSAHGARRPYRFVELLRTAYFERQVVASATVPIALSSSDADRFRSLNREVRCVPPGVLIPAEQWSGGSSADRTVVFTGAMWREANARAASRLAREIMPLVWRDHPDVRLRIVGAGPGPGVLDLTDDQRVVVVGRVASLDDELMSGSVVACPTVYGGGVLMKLLRALALGAPVVTDVATAFSAGVGSDVAALASSDAAFADRLRECLEAPQAAAALGARARAFVRANFGWPIVSERYTAAYVRARELTA